MIISAWNRSQHRVRLLKWTRIWLEKDLNFTKLRPTSETTCFNWLKSAWNSISFDWGLMSSVKMMIWRVKYYPRSATDIEWSRLEIKYDFMRLAIFSFAIYILWFHHILSVQISCQKIEFPFFCISQQKIYFNRYITWGCNKNMILKQLQFDNHLFINSKASQQVQNPSLR